MNGISGMVEISPASEEVAKLRAEVERLARERDAARENFRTAAAERDAALVKISKVAKRVAYPADAPPDFARDIREITGCRLCALLGVTCTHMGVPSP